MAELTFRPHEKLKDPADFKAVYEHRKSVSDRELGLIVYGKHNGLPHNRVGLSVGKRFHPRAVRRNRMKRLLREAYRLTRADLPAGLDLIFVPRCKGAPPLEALRAGLRKLVPAVLKRLGPA